MCRAMKKSGTQQLLHLPGLLLGLWVAASQSISVLCLTANNNSPTRRDFVNTGIIGTAGLLELSLPQVSLAADADPSNSQLPFCVIGANGKTGTKCVQDILSRGMPVRASSRGGVYYEAESETKKNNPLLLPTVCDVTIPSTVDAAVKGTRAVIFAASASKEGGTPSEVDNIGLKNVATACIANKIPHLVIVSSGGVSKPDSPIYKFLNVFGGIMEQKIIGEDTVRSMYANLNKESDQGLTYTIIRPGGLTEEPIRGVSEIELNQGDLKSGRISRYDLAKLCVEASFYPGLTGSTTFECYDGDTGKGLGSIGMSNLLKQKTNPAEFVTGKERRGQSYKALFTGLEKDA